MATLILIMALALAQPPADDAGWVDLFNGKNYAGFIFWIIAGPERTFDVKDGSMVFHPVPAGQTYTTDRIFQIDDQVHLSQFPISGFAYTRKQYANFDLKYEWKYERPTDLTDDSKFTGNSGAFIYLTRVLKSWPQSVEVDGKYTEAGKLLAYGKAHVEAKEYPDARKAAMKPVGEWNETTIHCKSINFLGLDILNHYREIRVTINGKLVSVGTTDQNEGAIGFQAQGACIYYRNIKVRELK
jgi:hypothetical protein